MRNRDLAFQLRGIARSGRVNHQEKRVLHEAAARIHPYARLMEYKALLKCDGAVCVEFRNSEEGLLPAVVLGFVVKEGEREICLAIRGRTETVWMPAATYDITWRCWQGRPSEEQLREEEWG